MTEASIDFERGVNWPTDLETGGEEYWRKWSVDHPAKAQTFWPVIQKLALRELQQPNDALNVLAYFEGEGKSTASRNNPSRNPTTRAHRQPAPLSLFQKMPMKKTTKIGGAK